MHDTKTATPTPTTTPAPLLDYCPRCVRVLGQPRIDHMHPPHTVTRKGGGAVARYACPACGHEWPCSWDAYHLAGIDLDA